MNLPARTDGAGPAAGTGAGGNASSQAGAQASQDRLARIFRRAGTSLVTQSLFHLALQLHLAREKAGPHARAFPQGARLPHEDAGLSSASGNPS